MVAIFISEGTLTDKSKVYDVIIYDQDQPGEESRISIPCTSKKDAERLEDIIRNAIQKHAA